MPNSTQLLSTEEEFSPRQLGSTQPYKAKQPLRCYFSYLSNWPECDNTPIWRGYERLSICVYYWCNLFEGNLAISIDMLYIQSDKNFI